MATLAEIDAEATAAVTAIKEQNWDEALLRISAGQILIAMTADMEMDKQRKEYRGRENHFEVLYTQVEKLRQRFSSSRGRITSIPVNRKCD